MLNNIPAGWISAGVALYGAATADDSSGGGGSSASNQSSTDAANTAANISKEQWNYYKDNYQPIEKSLISKASEENTPQAFDAARGRANADVENSFNGARKQTESRLQSYGINPGSPAYQSAMSSVGLAEGAANAGAQTTATNNQKNLAYSRLVDVAGLGRNIPAQSAASSASAAGTLNNSSQTQFLQNQQNQRNAGYGANAIGNGVGKLVGAASNWYNNNNSTPSYANQGTPAGYTSGSDLPSGDQNYQGWTSGSDLSSGYAKGGKVLPFKRPGLERKSITPHMKFASGGGVGRQGLESQPDASNMNTLNGPGTTTSDSIPAQIDGQQPAALSRGEFVINADAVGLTGEDMLKAINEAGLQKRSQYANSGLG